MAKNPPKSGKRTNETCNPAFWGDVGIKMKCEYLLWANIKRRAKIYCEQLSENVQRSAVSKYHKTCKDLLWASIGRYANIFEQISADGQRSFWQISAGVEISVGQYQQTC